MTRSEGKVLRDLVLASNKDLWTLFDMMSETGLYSSETDEAAEEKDFRGALLNVVPGKGTGINGAIKWSDFLDWYYV